MDERLRLKPSWRYVIVLIVLAMTITAIVFVVRAAMPQPITTAQKTRMMMDTTVEIRATGPDAEAAVNKALNAIQNVEDTFSRHLPDSAIAKINANAGEWVTVPEEVVALIAKAVYYSELTNGAFDISVGNLINVWGFGSGVQHIPSASEIEQALATVDYSAIEIDQENNRIRIPKGMIIDLGAIAKGYAIEQACKVLREHKVISGMVYAGGDIATIGAKLDGTPWRVAIQHPRKSTEYLAILEMVDQSIVTSGDYERYFIANGVRYHHILDPHTGYPARGLISVTILGKSATDTDALSTAIFVLGMEAGQKLIESLDGFEAVLVDEQGNIWVSPGLRDQIKIL